MYDKGISTVPWCCTTPDNPALKNDFKKTRGGIERFFALVKGKFQYFYKAHGHTPKQVALRFKCALILTYLNWLAELEVCKRQGKKLPESLVSVFGE